MKKGLWVLIAMIMLAGLQAAVGQTAVNSAGTSNVASKVSRGGFITVAKTNKMTTMNPTKSNARFEDNFVFSLIFEPLVRLDEKGNYIPGLATSWEVAADNKSIVFKLRKGVKFHDGTEFNAKVVKYDLEWYISPECNHAYFTSDLGNIASVDIVDDYSVRVNLSAPDAALFSAFSNISGFMMSPTAIKKGKDFLAVNAVGTGPFKVGEYVEGDHITLVANKDYYEPGEDGKPLPYLDKVIFRIMTDDSVKTTNLQSGDVDLVDYHSSANSVKKSQGMKNLTTVINNYRDTYFMCFNQNDPLLKNAKIRQAVSYAVNRQELMDVVLEGIGIVDAFDAIPDQWFYSDYNPYSYDPKKAKTLLAEAGYPNGIKITLSFIAREPDATMCQLLQEQLKASNITLKIESMERLAWVDLIRTNRGGQLGIGVIGIQGLDPNQQYNSLMVYVDPKYLTDIQKLLLSAKNTFNTKERKTILNKFQKEYLDSAYYVILGQRPHYVSYNKRLNNVRQFLTGNLDLKSTWVTK